jgi:hypothetical protein
VSCTGGGRAVGQAGDTVSDVRTALHSFSILFFFLDIKKVSLAHRALV